MTTKRQTHSNRISAHDKHTQLDPNAGRLERGLVQRHGKDKSLGRTLFRCPYDIRQLRVVQFAGRHSRRGFQLGGNYFCRLIGADNFRLSLSLAPLSQDRRILLRNKSKNKIDLLTITDSCFMAKKRNERREREQRELVKKLREENFSDNVNEFYDDVRSFSDSTATSDSFHEIKSKWHSAEELRKVRYSLT